MNKKSISWVNTPVLMEAILRYEQERLPKSMKLWIEKVLDLSPNSQQKLLTDKYHSP